MSQCITLVAHCIRDKATSRQASQSCAIASHSKCILCVHPVDSVVHFEIVWYSMVHARPAGCWSTSTAKTATVLKIMRPRLCLHASAKHVQLRRHAMCYLACYSLARTVQRLRRLAWMCCHLRIASSKRLAAKCATGLVSLTSLFEALNLFWVMWTSYHTAGHWDSHRRPDHSGWWNTNDV